MKTKAAAGILGAKPDSLVRLAGEGLIGHREIEGEPWQFSSSEIAVLLGYLRLKFNLTEAARIYRLKVVLEKLQSETSAALPDEELIPLQSKLVDLVRKLRLSKNVEVKGAVNRLTMQGGGGAARILQAV